MAQQQVKKQSDLEKKVDQSSPGLWREFVGFLLHNKKWWLTPVIVLLLLAALVAVIAGTAAGPWIYAIW